jgi:glycosyltransferase involved in cell wall biosynthesis
LERCIHSIIAQEECGASLECILIEDGSSDNSKDILLSLTGNYHGNIQFVVLEHQHNQGLSVARNTGIKAAHGDYILFVDSDDWLPDGALAHFVRVLQTNPEVEMISGKTYRTKQKDTIPFTITEPTQINNYQLRKYLLDNQNISCSAWNKLIRTDIVSKHLFCEGIIYEDVLWSYLICKDISNAVIIPDITYTYENNRPSSIINTVMTEEKAPLHFRSVSTICSAVMKAPYRDLYVESQLYFFNYLQKSFCLQYVYKIDNEESRHLNRIRRQFILHPLKNGKWSLFLYLFVLSYLPTTYIFKFKCVQRLYTFIRKSLKP